MTSAQTVIDQELEQFGWVGSLATNSISDFKSSKSNVVGKITNKKTSDLIYKFICHLIFNLIFAIHSDCGSICCFYLDVQKWK